MPNSSSWVMYKQAIQSYSSCLSIPPLTMCHTKPIFAGFLCAVTIANFIDTQRTPLSPENSISQESSFPAA